MNNSVDHLASELGTALLARGWRATCAESCTGGGVASAITDIAGSSQWFDAGFVCYANTVKSRLLGVPDTVLAQHGAVSEAAVVAMARGALAAADADVAVATSGIAGPTGGTADKPVGTVWFAWLERSGRQRTACHYFGGDRPAVRRQAVVAALAGLLAITK